MTHRPTFRVTPPNRGGGGGGTRVISERGKIFLHHQLPPPQLSPTMHLITKSRSIDESGSALVSLNQMNMADPDAPASQKPPDPVKEKLKRENFEEFAARMMRTASADELALGPEMHAALLSMANGIDPMLGQERKRLLKRRLQERLQSAVSAAAEEESQQVQAENQSEASDEQGQDAASTSGDQNKAEDAGADPHSMEIPFVSTFGAGLGRTSLDELESFQKRNKMWKSTLKSTLKYFERSNNSSNRGSERDLQTLKKSIAGGGRSSKKRDRGAKIQPKATKDLDRVLQRGSLLLMASSALKPEERSKSKERAEAEKAKNKEQIEYTPTHFVGRVKTGALRLPIYDRIDAKRQNALNQGFPFESLEAEMNEAVREAAREMKKSFRATADQPSTVDPPTQKRTPFDGIQISALVGNNAAKAQGFREKKAFGPPDTMNSFQLKLVQGLEGSQLSSFLENHGRRNPQIGMQIFPGKAHDPGMKDEPGGKSYYRPTTTRVPVQSRPMLWEPSPLEPKFRALPKTVISRFGEDFGVVKRQDAVGSSGGKGFPDFGSKYKNHPKIDWNFAKTTPKKPGFESLKKLSFMDVTKSQFIREMRTHQNEFQQMKSKDEMRKSFPKTYVFPRKEVLHPPFHHKK